MLLIVGDKIFSANVGDSRAVMTKYLKDSWYEKPLSKDHKPDLRIERSRILKAGGRVK